MYVEVVAVGKFYLPIDEPPVEVGPCKMVFVLGELKGDVAELLLVVVHRLLADEATCLCVFLDCEEDLVGLDRLDEVVGDLAS